MPPCRTHCLRHGDAISVSQGQACFRTQRSGDHPRADTGDPEPSALLIDEIDHTNRAGGPKTVGSQLVDRQQPTDNTERSIEGTTVRHAVEMRASNDSAGRGSIRIAPPPPPVSPPIPGQLKASARALTSEPFPHVQIRRSPSEASIAPGDRMTPA